MSAYRRQAGHIRQRSPETWELRWQQPDPVTGKNRTRTTTARGTRKDAERELRARLRAVDENAHVDPSRLTVAAYLDDWLSIVRPEVSPKTHERYGEIVKHYIVPQLGDAVLSKLAPIQIQKAYAKLETQVRRDGRPGGLSARTRHHVHVVLKSALKRAVALRLMPRNPADDAKPPKAERKAMETLTPKQSASLLAGLRHTRVYMPVLLALATGMRRGELLALRWGRIDFERRTLEVVESLEHVRGQPVRFKETKTGRQRAIALPAFAIDELRRWRKEQAEELLKLGTRQTAQTLICCRFDGQPLQPLSLTHEFSRLIGKLKDVPRIRFHDLRHSHATQLLAAGIHPKVAQERLGHSTISTTLDLYSHVTETMQREAAEKLDGLFGHATTATS